MPTSDFAPVVQDVADRLRARTKDRDGNEVGTFNANTRPTDTQVDGLINKAGADVAMVVGSDIPNAVWDDAKDVVSLRAALLVELSFFPEQINSGRSPYPQLKQLYDDDLKNLLAAVTRAGGDPGEAGAPMKPDFAFPMLGDPYIIGRRTPW